jgi:hypothetical protein
MTCKLHQSCCNSGMMTMIDPAPAANTEQGRVQEVTTDRLTFKV